MTMGSVKLHIEKYWQRKKNDWECAEYQAWLTGYYNMHAIGSNISNKIKYPNNPMKEEKVVIEDMVLTEEEKEEWRNKFFKNLRSKQDRAGKR